MKVGKHLISKRTLALTCVAVLLFTFGGVMGVRAARNAPDIMSYDLEADFELEHLGVHLLENGNPVGLRTDAIEAGNGKLLEYMKSEGDQYGTFAPGVEYDERIAARNRTDVNQYVRIIVHKYWQDPIRNNAGEITGFTKNTDLNPDLIELSYGGKSYNSGAWTINSREHTTESDTYYYNGILKGNEDSADLFDTLVVSEEILSDMSVETKDLGDGKKVIRYNYKYDDKYIGLEADVQSIQTHNANDAIKGIWGVQNVTVSGDKLNVN